MVISYCFLFDTIQSLPYPYLILHCCVSETIQSFSYLIFLFYRCFSKTIESLQYPLLISYCCACKTVQSFIYPLFVSYCCVLDTIQFWPYFFNFTYCSVFEIPQSMPYFMVVWYCFVFKTLLRFFFTAMCLRQINNCHFPRLFFIIFFSTQFNHSQNLFPILYCCVFNAIQSSPYHFNFFYAVPLLFRKFSHLHITLLFRIVFL